MRCQSYALILIAAASPLVVYLCLTSGWNAPSKPLDLTYGIHRPVLTYLHRRRGDGKFVDVQEQSTPRVPANVADFTGKSGARLEVMPAVVANGGTVEVTWRGVSAPRSDDWIGFFCPHDAKDDGYLDYWQVVQCPTHGEGHGTATFAVFNLRLDCEFRYYTSAGGADLRLLARSGVVTFDGGPRAPVHGHLAFTGEETQMRVQWTSGSRDAPTVKYGLASDALTLAARGSTRTYNYTDMCGPPANTSEAFVDPGYLHDVLLSDLVPSTKYYYRFGCPGAWSDTLTFTTPPRPGDESPFTFLTYGDMGLTPPPGSYKVTGMLAAEVERGAAFIVHQGDLSYAVGYGYIWDQWMTLIEPYASRVPYMVGIGNHEQNHLVGGKRDPSHDRGEGFHPPWGNYGHDSGGECGVPVYSRFHMPDTGHQPWWYSFDYGTLHVIVLSTEHDFEPGSRQYDWLEGDLHSVDRGVTPWIVAAGHRPMYCSEDYPADYEVTLNMQRALEDLFHLYRVDMALWGHYHSYERTCPVYRGACDPSRGVVHVMVGSAGMFIVHADKYNVPWSAHFELSYGYGRVTVANRSSLLWEFVRSIDGSIGDSVWLNHR